MHSLETIRKLNAAAEALAEETAGLRKPAHGGYPGNVKFVPTPRHPFPDFDRDAAGLYVARFYSGLSFVFLVAYPTREERDQRVAEWHDQSPAHHVQTTDPQPAPDAEGWIKNTGQPPRAHTVEVVLGGGVRFKDWVSRINWSLTEVGPSARVVKYRVIN